MADNRFSRLLQAMEMEEKILHTGVLMCLLGAFFPWVGGQWYGSEQQWNAFGFHTGYIGHTVLLIQIFLLMMTGSPLVGGPVLVRKSRRNVIRLLLTSLSTILLLGAMSIALRLTREMHGTEIRFGLYLSIIGSALATLYAFLRYQEELRNQAKALFRHPDEQAAAPVVRADAYLEPGDIPPPQPPIPPAAENHSYFNPPRQS